MVKLEERDQPNNQYHLLKKAGIRMPKIFENPKKINCLVIVKVAEAKRGYERAFFFCNDYKSYTAKSNELLNKKVITKQALNKAAIEEYIIGAQVNFNYFYSVLDDELELMGTDTRRQTNLDGLLRLPSDVQLEVLKYLQPKLIETGHIAVTTKESILEKIFEIGTGSGYQAALLAKLTGDKGKVITTEVVPELVEFSKSNFKKTEIKSGADAMIYHSKYYLVFCLFDMFCPIFSSNFWWHNSPNSKNVKHYFFKIYFFFYRNYFLLRFLKRFIIVISISIHMFSNPIPSPRHT